MFSYSPLYTTINALFAERIKLNKTPKYFQILQELYGMNQILQLQGLSNLTTIIRTTFSTYQKPFDVDTESVNINFDIYKQPVYTQLTVRIKVLSNLQGSIILQEATTKKSVENNFYNIANKIFIDSTTVSLRFICFLGNFFRFSRFQNFKTITTAGPEKL